MRYKVGFPLESGEKIAVFDLKDKLFPEKRKILTLIPDCLRECDFPEQVKQIESRVNLQHPSIPGILDAAFRGSYPGLVTEYFEHPSLDRIIGTVSLENSMRITLLLLDLLHQLHHRRFFIGYLNPRKIFIKGGDKPLLNFLIPAGTSSQVQISDYSMRYAAPEYLETGNPSSASDLYSLGMVLYLLFTGSPPFIETMPGELRRKKKLVLPAPIRNINPLLDRKIASLIDALLHPDPQNRPASKELIQALRKILPRLKTVPLEFRTGMIGREKEIREFQSILDDPEKGTRIVFIEGNPGVGKSRLADYFQLTATLRRFKVQTLHGGCTESTAPATEILKNKKLLLRILNSDGDALIHMVSRLAGKVPGNLIILNESTDNHRTKEFPQLTLRRPEVKIHRFRLNQLNRQKTRIFVDSLLGDNTGYYFYRKTSGSSQGNPFLITRFIQDLYDSGGLLREAGTWLWLPEKCNKKKVPEQIRARTAQQLGTLTSHQLSLLKLLAIYDREIPFQWLTEIPGNREIPLFETACRLEELDLAVIREKSCQASIALTHKWISETILDQIPPKEKEKIHREISGTLEKIYSSEKNFSMIFDLCLHSIRGGKSAEATVHLPEAITYLIKNSSFRSALQLFEEALSRGLVTIELPANWLTYVKLLLKTGSEKKCRSFLKNQPLFPLDNVLLFRLGYLLESLDLEAREICPQLSASIDLVFSQASRQGILRTSGNQNSHLSRRENSLNINYFASSDSSIQEKTRHYHQLFCMHQEQGRSERALYYEIKAFRLSLSLGKKGVAARRLLNVAKIILSKGQTARASFWLQHCLKMADETGDMKTRLEAEIHLTLPDRIEGRHRKAEFNLARIRTLNQSFCGSRKISCLLLLEEAENLFGRSRYEQAEKKIMELTRRIEGSGDTMILAESILLEARISVERGNFDKARGHLEKLRKLSVAGQHNFFSGDNMLRAIISLHQGDLSSAELSINQLLSRKIFLPPGRQIKTRILQAELSLLKNDLPKAGIYIHDAIRNAEKNYITPLLAEAFLVKARWLIMKNDFRQSLRYSLRASRLARRTDREEIELKASLIRAMAAEKAESGAPFPLNTFDSERAAGAIRLESGKPVNLRHSFHFKIREFIAFIKNEQNPGRVAREMLNVIKETFPEADAGLFVYRNGALARFNSDIKAVDCEMPENRAENQQNYTRLLSLDPGSAGKSTAVNFPIGLKTRPCGILSVTFPSKILVSESDYEFLRLLTELSGSSFSGREKTPVASIGIAAHGVTLQSGKVIVGQAPCILDALNRMMRVAEMKTTVLIQGETGTGKELMARALHDFSRRKTGPFIPVNCSSLPSELVENELFGHTRGSFTGADSSTTGLFEAAAGGTIFLDEISTLSLELQPRLLRVLENKTVRPLGSSLEKHLDMRVVAATNQDLEALARSGRFRFDLLQRLKAFSISVPPLRKRKSDIHQICLDYIEKHPLKNDKELSDNAVEELCKYDFPGNVRELLNILENLLCFSPSEIISAADVRDVIPAPGGKQPDGKTCSMTLEIMDRIYREKLDFWEGVRDPFINRDINRNEVRDIISEGLKSCNGSYKGLLEYFNLPAGEYKKFLSFLEHHDCKVDFRKFRK